MRATAYTIEFKAQAEGVGVEVAAAITADGGQVPQLKTEADGRSFYGRAVIPSENAEQAVQKLRASVERAAAAAGTTVEVTMNDARPSSGVG
jgi:hypothetical protein